MFNTRFTFGFAFHSVNFLYFAFVEPYCHSKTQDYGEFTATETTLLLSAFILEWLLRLIMYLGSALQLIFVMSKAVAYCAFEAGTLDMERTWMLVLAITQVVMGTVFTIWKI